ncbi:MAG: hypothetical protein J5U19_15510 [Candidatus Methanoperedens sp.]|nr:hypothetical protein [Candidatus Methanoperedens sp.]
MREDKKEPDPLSVLQKISELPKSENTDVVQSQSSAEGDKNDILDSKNLTLPGDTKPSGDTSNTLPLSEGKFVLQPIFENSIFKKESIAISSFFKIAPDIHHF